MQFGKNTAKKEGSREEEICMRGRGNNRWREGERSEGGSLEIKEHD